MDDDRTCRNWPPRAAPRDAGTAIRETRRQLGLTQAELAELTGAPRQYLVELEAGKQTLHLSRLLAVLAVLGLELIVRPRSGGIDSGTAVDDG